MCSPIPLIIPAYEPDERLLSLLENIRKVNISPVIIVDDGSGIKFRHIFDQAEKMIAVIGGAVLRHDTNKGKGRALKTAFSFVLEHYPDSIGAITADSDGQHSVDCIEKVTCALKDNPLCLILGVRSFDGDDVPWKSQFGNNLTKRVLGYVSGIHVTDTQTGLRGIPIGFMRELLDVKGERFEFETQMLLECSGRYPIVEVPIKTIYDSKENHQTHFNPIVDSIKIYRILGAQFIKYIVASLSSSLLDLILFTIFCYLLKTGRPRSYVAISTVAARVISAFYNYCINYKVVFRSRENIGKAAFKYVMLAIFQMTLSALLVTGGVRIFTKLPEVSIKIVVDTILFFISYRIQQKYIFQKESLR